ncbi:sigma-70 family RNA polymerase sigma factor [Lachnoclostridium pacaense]|uniref:RNA polymerase sigma factor n=1 Tax=Enterocloster hominis (ex Hitch et al. 2024) TaxID=1917870 RepID=UPI001D12D3C1|nr:sigma-70 family RNA polymerase sigma factor [Lachnoclostridium pacaense]MCC2879004.1 sigma-70 family RNA polymerase sigma factor [Lachnoclostridium pacaense]
MENLIKKAKLRDADAFTKLMQQQMQNMYKTARAVLYNEEDVADAISDTILACWEKIGQLKQDGYFRTWMTRILVNKCTDIIQKKKQFCLMEDVPEIPSRDNGYEDTEWKEALNMLGERYRLIMILYYVEGFKISEISSILDIAESTVRTRLSRGREKLAEDYRPELRRKQI